MKTAYIVMNGNLSRGIPEIKPSKFDLIICADGGAEYAKKQKIIPHIIIGDCDSITPDTKKYFKRKSIKFIEYPREKDFTDSQLALEYALKHGVQKIIIFGFFGDRVDHMLSNIYHLSKISEKVPCIFVEGSTEMQFIHSAVIFEGKTGDELSLIPLKSDAEGVTTKGLYYPLNNEVLRFGTTRGISNVFSNNKVEITLQKGTVFAVHRKQT